MRTIIKALFIMIAIASMFGCATTGPKYSELAASMSNMPPDTGRLYVYRTIVLGAAVQPEVKLNGEVIGKAVPMGFFYVDKAPGTYEIMTSTEVDRKLSLTLDKGQVRYVRLNISMGFFVGHVYPELVDNNVGEKEIQDCRCTNK
jgi:predicted small lipoprotein YifL